MKTKLTNLSFSYLFTILNMYYYNQPNTPNNNHILQINFLMDKTLGGGDQFSRPERQL